MNEESRPARRLPHNITGSKGNTGLGSRKRRPGLFRETCFECGWLRNGSWSERPVERRLTREELSEAYRLWVVHADVRTGQAKP
jgi:hypothetical protein